MMRVTAILLFATVALQASPNDSILSCRDAVWRAWFAGDTATLNALVPDDAIAVSAGDPGFKHKPQILSESAQFHAAGGELLHLRFPATEIQRFGNTAFVYSEYELEFTQKGKRMKSHGRVTEVFLYKNGRWLNPGWHTERTE